MKRLEGALRTYPWGSRTLLAQLRGTQTPAPTPEAELWFGAHSAAPSHVNGTALDTLIEQNPSEALGERVVASFGEELPFLLKLLAADEPLSIQAHPSKEQAQDGFARENAAGIPLGDPSRNYKDPNPKPELIVALTEFEALAGFRPLEQTQAFFDALDCAALDRYTAMLDLEDESASLRALFTTLISLPADTRNTLIGDLATAAGRLAQREPVGEEVRLAQVFLRLHNKYPTDVGLLAALLLNYVEFHPGEALYLDAGQLHAYLSGLGVEIMANSDNVLRGGLTSKHVDVPELVRVLQFTTLQDPHAHASRRVSEDGNTEVVDYKIPVNEFQMSRYTLHEGGELSVLGDGPAIVLCTHGEASAGEHTLRAGEAAWIPAADGPITFNGSGTELFYARV